METLFIVNLASFKGGCDTTAHNGYADYSGPLYNNGGENLTIQEYIDLRNKEDNGNFKALTWAEMEPMVKAYEKETYLTPAIQIDKARWWEMLEILPPENWCNNYGFEHFRMMEYTTGSITTQFARLGDKYIEKSIDTANKESWITRADFEVCA